MEERPANEGKRHRTRLKLLLGAFAMLAGCTFKPGPGAPIGTVGAMLRLSENELAGGCAVELRGVVTLVDPAWRLLVIQDETGGVLVDLPSRPPSLLRGDMVEVRGATSADGHVPSVVATSLRTMGRGSLPTPVNVSPSDAIRGLGVYRLVQVELTPETGAFGDAAHTARFTAHAGTGSVVAIGRYFRRLLPSTLAGRRLRVRGVLLASYAPTGRIDRVRLMFEDESDVDIIDQPAGQPVGQPVQAEATVAGPVDPGLPTLRSASEVKSLSPVEAARGYPVNVEGIVTSHNLRHDGFVLQDGQIAIYAFQSLEERAAPAPGQRVRVVGRSAAGGFAPVIRESQIEVLGLSDPPKPVHLTFGEPFRSADENTWVELEGVATAIAHDQSGTTLQLFCGTKRVRVRFAASDAPAQLERFVNARVSVQGVYGPVFTESGVRTGSVILTPSPTFVKIVSVPRAAETRSIASITQFDLRGFPGHRVRIPGSVTYRDDEGVAYLQDGDNALRIVRATAGEPSLHARAVVEGFIAPDTAVPQLEEAHWVSQAPDSPVAPVRALAETLATGDLEGRLVEVEGFLESRRTTGGRLQLNLQTGRTRYTASLAAPASANGFPALRPGALVRLSGICVNRASGEANGGRSASLLLRTPDDLVVVQAAPWWDLRRSLYAAFAASALLVMALGWVVFLRVHLLRQVSLRAKLEDRLRHAQKLESLGRLAGGVAHDFNNYLTVIMGYSSQVLDRLHPRDPNREALATIHDVSSQAAGLTRQLLAFGRRQVLQPVHCDLDELLNQARKTLLPLIGETVELVVRQGGNLDPVRIDPVQFMEVLVNLAVNARDAMPAGGRLIYQTANVELYDEDVRHRAGLHVGRYVRLTVTDTGTGMDAETRKRIFEPFFTTKQQGRGTGLGLAVVFGIVEQSGGHIEVESEPGQGSTFRAYLPVADGKPEPRVAEAAPPAVLLRGQETVLVVEDQDGVRALVSAVLKARGLRVVAAADPAQTLEIMESMAEPAQLLLTDMRMPGMSGQALSELVKAKWPGIRVLYMSGYSEEAARDHAGPAGCFIQKPFSPAQLAEAVERMLAEIV